MFVNTDNYRYFKLLGFNLLPTDNQYKKNITNNDRE